MIFMNRKITSEVKQESEGFRYQAAINSDGNITLRTVVMSGSTMEEGSLIIFNKGETDAIFNLMRVMRHKENSLPF